MMIKLFYAFLFLLNLALSGSKVFGFTVQETESNLNDGSALINSRDSISENERLKQEQLMKIFELLQMIRNHPPNKNFNHFNFKNLHKNDVDDDDDEQNLSRDRRRLSVFKDIYQRCRIQKRKEKTLCLYLANLYQNIKGFHGL